MSKNHPLFDVGLQISKFKCFGDEGGGILSFQPINIIIGRNNTEKSALIDAVDLCISKGKNYVSQKHARLGSEFTVQISQKLDTASLQVVFPENTRSNRVPGHDDWSYGSQFLGQILTRSYSPRWEPKFRNGPDFIGIRGPYLQEYQNKLSNSAIWPFENLRLLRIAAERDVRPEERTSNRSIYLNGNGTTNLVRAFITNANLPRDEVECGLLDDLNEVYQGDCTFKQIISQEDDNGVWELYLTEDEKGDIRLSESGSSLKSAFIIMLCMLRLLPIIENIDWKRVVLAIEEPENNLHPALLRRLLYFLADRRKQQNFLLIITTHSPIAIDLSARRSDRQIVHVRHDGKEARCRAAIEYHENREILEDLDIRASDILQANCVIWVEGPSDRIYLRH